MVVREITALEGCQRCAVCVSCDLGQQLQSIRMIYSPTQLASVGRSGRPSGAADPYSKRSVAPQSMLLHSKAVYE